MMSKRNIRDDFHYFVRKNETYKAVKEAIISIACLQDDNFESTKELDKDLEHIQKQLTIVENYFEEIDN
jgi:hypothetical protein